MKKFFNIKGAKNENVCPICGGNLIDDFCNVCNKYSSPEIAHKKLKEKYPNIRCKCKSKKIVFSVEETKSPNPRNILDKTALNIIGKYNQKYPKNTPPFREVAKCNKCGNKWYVDGYKDDGETMVSLRNGFLVFLAVLFLVLIIMIGSISENNKVDSVTTQTDDQVTITQTTDIPTTVTTTETTTIMTTTETETTAETTTETTTERYTTTTVVKSGITVYITPYGEKYHYSANCAGGNAMKRDYDDVKNAYDPCKKCAY